MLSTLPAATTVRIKGDSEREHSQKGARFLSHRGETMFVCEGSPQVVTTYSVLPRIFFARIGSWIFLPRTVPFVSGNLRKPSNARTTPFCAISRGYGSRWPWGSSFTSAPVYAAQFSAARARTRRTQLTSWGCWNTSSSRPRCSSQHVMRCPYTTPRPWGWKLGWKAPMAISVSRSPAIDRWLILALPSITYSSSTMIILAWT
mmetsp:Transcript_9813/g.29515  ORF Transcript_9813/g.29515 Transcript_9813/m.29515 type:complete len:203 (+) Transcript_9813:1919-2527(+)